jgi:hypothetical protein
MTDDQKTKINDAIKGVEEALAGNNKDLITEKLSELYVAGQILAEAKVTPTADTTTEQPKKDENVVDADFTEVKKD